MTAVLAMLVLLMLELTVGLVLLGYPKAGVARRSSNGWSGSSARRAHPAVAGTANRRFGPELLAFRPR